MASALSSVPVELAVVRIANKRRKVQISPQRSDSPKLGGTKLEDTGNGKVDGELQRYERRSPFGERQKKPVDYWVWLLGILDLTIVDPVGSSVFARLQGRSKG